MASRGRRYRAKSIYNNIDICIGSRVEHKHTWLFFCIFFVFLVLDYHGFKYCDMVSPYCFAVLFLRSHEKFHIQLLRTATKFFKIFERKECELILGYRLKLYLLIIIGATDSSSGLDGGLSKETVDCRNKRWIK